MGRDGGAVGRRSVSASDRYVETNGIRLHYLDHAGDGPTLVLAPGLSANAHSFDGLMRAGLGDVAHVLALDLRGRGESDAPPTGYAMEDHARDVIGLLDVLDLDRVVMGGHSFGGLLTYWLAANHPERVERCVVLDAPAGVSPTIMEQIEPSLARLGHVYASWDEYLALVRALPYFAEGGWDADVESYFRADAHSLPDGMVQARSRPEHIREAVALSVGRRLGGRRPPRRATDAPPQGSRQLRAARIPAAPLPRGRGGDGGVDGGRPARRRGRKPHHVLVRAGCTGPDRRDRSISRRGAVVSGRGSGDSGTAGVVRWRWR